MFQGTWRHVQKSTGIHLFARCFQKEPKRLPCQKTDKHTRWNRIFPPLNQEFICLVPMAWALDETTWHIVLGHLRVSSLGNAEWRYSCWEACWSKLSCKFETWTSWCQCLDTRICFCFTWHGDWRDIYFLATNNKKAEKFTTRNTTWRHLDKGQQVPSGHWFHLLDSGSCTCFTLGTHKSQSGFWCPPSGEHCIHALWLL